MGGKKRAKQYFQKKTNRASKKYSEKIDAKKCEKTFFHIHKKIVSKKWGEKTRETIFPETQQIVREKM